MGRKRQHIGTTMQTDGRQTLRRLLADTEGIFLRGSLATNSLTCSGGSTKRPSGLLRIRGYLGQKLVGRHTGEAVNPSSRWISARIASAIRVALPR